jgi:four helix bundle protein
MQPFRRLDVWKRAHAHALNVRKATRAFPRRGYTSLKSQIIDAAESVPFNIVEGCGADTNKEFARFLGISIKSTMELEAELQMARDCRVLSLRDWQLLTRETIEIRRMLWGLRKKVLEGETKPRTPRNPLADKTDRIDQTADSLL